MITNYDYMQMQMKDIYEGHIRGQNKSNAHSFFLKERCIPPKIYFEEAFLPLKVADALCAQWCGPRLEP